jgi:hypothetical protein
MSRDNIIYVDDHTVRRLELLKKKHDLPKAMNWQGVINYALDECTDN